MVQDHTLQGNERIKEVISLFHREQSEELFIAICLAIREQIAKGGHFIFPADVVEEGSTNFLFKTMDINGVAQLVAFTDQAEYEKAPSTGAVSQFIDVMLENLLQQEEIGGMIINPFGENIVLGKEDIAMILLPGSERFI